MSCHEFLTYLYDRPDTRELARVLAAAALRQPIDEATRQMVPRLQPAPVNAA